MKRSRCPAVSLTDNFAMLQSTPPSEQPRAIVELLGILLRYAVLEGRGEDPIIVVRFRSRDCCSRTIRYQPVQHTQTRPADSNSQRDLNASSRLGERGDNVSPRSSSFKVISPFADFLLLVPLLEPKSRRDRSMYSRRGNCSSCLTNKNCRCSDSERSCIESLTSSRCSSSAKIAVT